MLDFDLFQAQIELLREMLGGSTLSPEAISAYYGAVSHLSDDRFLQCCGTALKELEFFPKPKWFCEKAIELAHSHSQERKALPFAEPEVASCPAYVRQWMQLDVQAGEDLYDRWRNARRQAANRLMAEHLALTGKRLSQLNGPMLSAIEKDADVVACCQAIKTHHNRDWRAEMAALKMSVGDEAISVEVVWSDIADDIGSAMPTEDDRMLAVVGNCNDF
ncbi:MAG: hypothetical protein ACRC62_36920 [Microcoleus sp.]